MAFLSISGTTRSISIPKDISAKFHGDQRSSGLESYYKPDKYFRAIGSVSVKWAVNWQGVKSVVPCTGRDDGLPFLDSSDAEHRPEQPEVVELSGFSKHLMSTASQVLF